MLNSQLALYSLFITKSSLDLKFHSHSDYSKSFSLSLCIRTENKGATTRRAACPSKNMLHFEKHKEKYIQN